MGKFQADRMLFVGMAGQKQQGAWGRGIQPQIWLGLRFNIC